MLQKVFKTGDSILISLPKEAQEVLDLRDGVEVEVSVDRQNRQVIITPIELPPVTSGVDETFARQVAEFIEEYRTALETLSK